MSNNKNQLGVSKEHYDLLEEDHEKYLSGELSTDSYENVKARLYKKYIR